MLMKIIIIPNIKINLIRRVVLFYISANFFSICLSRRQLFNRFSIYYCIHPLQYVVLVEICGENYRYVVRKQKYVWLENRKNFIVFSDSCE